MGMKTLESPQQLRNTFGFSLQIMQRKECQLVEYNPLSDIRGMFEIHDSLQLSFSLAGYLRRLQRSFIKLYHLAWIHTHHSTVN